MMGWMTMNNPALLAAMFAFGWAACTAFNQALTTVFMRLLASRSGKEKALEALAESIARLGDNGKP